MNGIRSLFRAHVDQGSPTSNVRQGSNNTHNNNTNIYATRISKVEFPRFDGKNVRDWLYKCDQFFLLDETLAPTMVRLTSIHLDGLALQWHFICMLRKFYVYPPWPQYVTARFSDVYEDPLSSLLKVKYNGLLSKPTMSPPPSFPTTPIGIPNNNQQANFPRQVRTYSALEMDDRRAKGLCMFYDEQFTPGH
ncbi:hypothetical protein KIW84_015554 [Lathyrus oleraceus]|uniref:Retrotransposon gag domain-containing protein n=1 Tax=Pisum sativum TaxID=3888 RepID=A0A9D5H142_PEA|nr:hypothetical protein KIW84_015554 [Pisum sativum]